MEEYIYLALSTGGFIFSVFAFINSIKTNNRVAHKKDILELKQEMLKLDKRVDIFYKNACSFDYFEKLIKLNKK
jgi:hypothetical protein